MPGAIAQITIATLMGWGLAALLGWSLAAGLVFGLALSVASTVVLLRALEQLDLFRTDRGRIAIGWLIVEDLAMVLALVLLPPVARMLESGANGGGLEEGLLLSLAIPLGKVALFVALMLVGGRRAVPWVLGRIARTGSRELFTLAVLAIAPGILQRAGVEGAALLLVTVPDALEGGGVVEYARDLNPRIAIAARAHSDEAVTHLGDHGADAVFMGEREIARRMIEYVQERQAPPEPGRPEEPKSAPGTDPLAGGTVSPA